MEKLLLLLFSIIFLGGIGTLLAILVFLYHIAKQTGEMLSCLQALRERLPAIMTPSAAATAQSTSEKSHPPLQARTSPVEPPTAIAPIAYPAPASTELPKTSPDVLKPAPEVTSALKAAKIAEPSIPVATPIVTPPPRAPSPLALAVKAKLQLWRNWFLYGQTQSPAESGQRVEKLVATTWLLRAGILVIIFTAAFLLKLSIERGMLAPSGRVAVSYICGAALLLWGLKMLNGTYQRLGQAILGISLVLFYFSTYALTAMYHLAPAWTAAILLALTTIAAGFISHRFNSLAVALIAILGGYGTPLMLSTDAKNFPALFAYMLVLGLGVLWLAIQRNWLPLNWLGMLFSYALYYLSYYRHYSHEDFPVLLIALGLFFALYSTTTFIHNVRRRIPATVLEVLALLSNASLFFILAWELIGRRYTDRLYFAPLTIGLTVFYMAHAYLFMHKKLSDKGLVLSFLGLAALFLALTFPVVLSGEWLGAAWALQALLMLWLGYSFQSQFLRGAAWMLFAITLLRYVFRDLFQAFPRASGAGTENFWLSFWERLIQFCVPIAALAAAARLSQRPPEEGPLCVPVGSDLKKRQLPFSPAQSLLGFGGVFLFLYLNLEVYRTVGYCYAPFRTAAITWLWILGAMMLTHLILTSTQKIWRHLFILLFLAILSKTFFFDFLAFNKPSWQLYYTLPAFLWRDSAMRILDFSVLVLALLWFQNAFQEKEQQLGKFCTFLWPVLLFVYSTWELNTVLQAKLPGLMGGGVSVLWGVFAFCFVSRGLQRDWAFLRYTGLCLFAIIVAKVFFYDLSKLDAIFRIIAFLLFGLMLMGAAFIYLKSWKNDSRTES